MSTLTQDDKKRAVARKAIDFVPDDSIIGVGTGSTVNFFIDELARIKARIDGCVSSSDASTARLKAISAKSPSGYWSARTAEAVYLALRMRKDSDSVIACHHRMLKHFIHMVN